MHVDAIPSDALTREKVIGIMVQRFGDQFTTADAIRERHGKGESYHSAASPDGVFFAKSTEDVAEVVKICSDPFIFNDKRISFRASSEGLSFLFGIISTRFTPRFMYEINFVYFN